MLAQVATALLKGDLLLVAGLGDSRVVLAVANPDGELAAQVFPHYSYCILFSIFSALSYHTLTASSPPRCLVYHALPLFACPCRQGQPPQWQSTSRHLFPCTPG